MFALNCALFVPACDDSLVYLVDGTAHGAFLVAAEVEASFFGVVTQKLLHFILSGCHLFQQIAAYAIPVQMVVSALFADKTEIFRIEDDVVEYILADIGIAFITQSQFGYRAARVGKV